MHTVGLSVDVCRLPTDARVAVNGDLVNVLVNACHVVLFDGFEYFYYGRKHDVPTITVICFASRRRRSRRRLQGLTSVTHRERSGPSLSTGHAMGLNTNLKQDAEVLRDTKVRDKVLSSFIVAQMVRNACIAVLRMSACDSRRVRRPVTEGCN